MNKTYLYDVCNDYSLEVSTKSREVLKLLHPVPMTDGVAYYDNMEEGYVYYEGKAGLSGKVLHPY